MSKVVVIVPGSQVFRPTAREWHPKEERSTRTSRLSTMKNWIKWVSYYKITNQTKQ